VAKIIREWMSPPKDKRQTEEQAKPSLGPLCNKDRNPPGGALLVFGVRRIRRNGKLPEPRPFSLVLDLFASASGISTRHVAWQGRSTPQGYFAADAHDCIMVRSLSTYRIQGCGAMIRARWQAPL
jgi:hypothetical protein